MHDPHGSDRTNTLNLLLIGLILCAIAAAGAFSLMYFGYFGMP